MEEFKIRTYGKTELALKYAPELTGSGALKKLQRWIKFNPRLRPLLKIKGRVYTPRQVRRIVEELGEP